MISLSLLKEPIVRRGDNADGDRSRNHMPMTLRDRLVKTALAWQDQYGVAPAITTAISEYDAAVTLLGMLQDEYRQSQVQATAVQPGHGFVRDSSAIRSKPTGLAGGRAAR